MPEPRGADRNLHRAVQEGARQAGQAIVVEVFFDCLQVHQAGYGNVVALLGVSLSAEQEHLLETHFRELILMLDGDQAGRRASRQLVARLRGKVSLWSVEVPSGRQPDQLSSREIERLLGGANSAARA
jgi:DNA primase